MHTQAEARHGLAQAPKPVARARWLAVGLILMGIGAAVVAGLGPLVIGAIEYHTSEGVVDQVAGGDVAVLLLVAPASITAGILVWRRHPGGPVLALAPASYALYMYSQLALGGDVFRYPGNSERFFLLYLGLFVLAAAIAVVAWTAIDSRALPETPRNLNVAFGWFTLAVAVFLIGGLHLPGLVDAWADQPVATEYLADPVVFWLVKFMDLGLVVPLLVTVGIGVLRGSPRMVKAKYAVVAWMALLGSSVAGMAIVMQATGDPAAAMGNTIAFCLFAIIALVMAALVYRPLFVSRRWDG